MEPTLKPKRTKSPEQALTSLMRLCARSEKSTGDARRLLRGWGVVPEEAEKIIQRLIKERFIDDKRYAAAFVREKCRLSGWGAYKIRTALKRKEIPLEVIEEALQEIDPEANRERLRGQIARKACLIKAKNNYDLRAKLMRYGLSLGFDFEAVSEAVNQHLKNTDETCDTLFFF